MNADATNPAGAAVTAPLSAKQAQGVRSREEILDAAEALMGRLGYTATSIAAVSKDSGLPASSIYWHFGSKSGLLGAVMERGSQRFFADVPVTNDPGTEPRDRVQMLMERSVDNICRHPQFLRLFIVLLLGAEGQHAQDQVISRVRRQGAALLTIGMRNAYLPWGEDLAGRIGAELGPLALVLFDGLFISTEAATSVHEPCDDLVGRAVAALHSLATAIRDEAR